MNNPKFYIYGVPDGFNMLSGTPDEILYYQLFYDTSKKGREMRINRKANGETVYSYLIYNLVACKGREGAFLGMSIVFTDNVYCDNPVALIELFEGVYNEVILKADDKDKIIAAIDGSNAVGRFCITKFNERQEMCEKIGRIIVNNVVVELASSIRSIDTSFDNSKEGRILTLPLNTDNNGIMQALYSYTWVSLSSEYKEKPIQSVKSQGYLNRKPTTITVSQDLLSPHFINELSEKVKDYKDIIIDGLKGKVTFTQIACVREEISRHLDTIEEYKSRQPELKKLVEEYIAIYKELVGLETQQQNVSPQPEPQPILSKKEKGNDFFQLIRPYLSKIIIACTVLVIAIFAIKWQIDKHTPINQNDNPRVAKEQENGTDEGSIVFDEKSFLELLSDANYKSAWSMLQKVTNREEKEKLVSKLQESYRDWFNKEYKNGKNDLQTLRNLKEKIASFADFNKDNILHNNLLNEEINALQKKQEYELETQKTLEAQREEQKKLAEKRKQREERQSKADNSIIQIFKSNVNFEKVGTISVSAGNVISCKKNDSFVVEGANSFSKVSGNIQISRTSNIRIKADRIGEHKIQLNQVVYTFKVTP